MRAFVATLVSIAGLSSLVAVLLLGALIWIFTPAVLGSDSTLIPIVLAALPFVIWLVAIMLLGWRRGRRDSALIAGATEAKPEEARAKANDAALREDEADAGRRLADALGALKTASKGKGGYLYERPWYVMIGPPGAGKTTAIQNSGLDFPLDAGRVRGVGGTRNCDWWIAEQAVLIDTAGRYTTQDTDAASDKAGWERFLDMLRRERPRQPLNGVIVAFGADMLSRLGQDARDENAKAVRSRIKDLETRLGQRLPVYFLVSKIDLVAGFSEFYDDLNRDVRSQVWGMTFPMPSGPAGEAGRFHDEFSALVARLQDRLLERLQAERGPAQRAQIAGFPAQFASLEPVLEPFVRTAFGGSQLDPAPFLRGVYFASGTQEGTPIDRLTGALSRTFGLAPRRASLHSPQAGRSYFLGRLLRDVVFNEARLAARDRGRDRRRLAIQVGAWSLAGLLVVGGGAWGVTQMRAEQARTERLTAAVTAAQAASKGLVFDPVTGGGDLDRVLPYLDDVRRLPDVAGGGTTIFGISQQDKLVSAARDLYGRVLDRVLLPRLLARLEGQMRGGLQKPDYLYEATRVYLMLGREGQLDKGLVTEWMGLDWNELFPGAVGTASRDSLAAHLQSLLDQDFAKYPLDESVVAEARIVFSKLTMAERVYRRLSAAPPVSANWRAVDVLGPAGLPWFATVSGKDLASVGVPGLYTADGLQKSFLPRLPAAIGDAASESWLLGEQSSATAGDPRQLEAGVLDLYAKDYVRRWQSALADIAVQPFKTLKQASDGLNVLSAPNSPIRDLLQSAAKQSEPGTPPAGATLLQTAGKAIQGAAAATGVDPTAATQGAAAAAGQSRLSSVLGAAVSADPAGVVNDLVAASFQPLRGAAGQQLDGDLAHMAELYAQVARAANAAPGSAPAAAADSDPAQRLSADAKLRPEPLSRWLQVIAQSTASLMAGGVKATIAAAANQQLTPFCSKAETRFPFSRGSTAEMPIDDFIRLFGPNGGFDQFFNQHLRPYVDTTRKPWRPVAPDGMTPPVSAGDVAQLQRAAAIRDAFFPAAGGAQTAQGFRFDLLPLSLGAGATSASIEAEGAKVQIDPVMTFAKPVQLQWPAHGSIVLNFEPPSSAATLATDGPWAALRFVARGRLSPGKGPDRMRLSLQQGDKSAEFELRAGSIVNPFGLRELGDFRCPRFAP